MPPTSRKRKARSALEEKTLVQEEVEHDTGKGKSGAAMHTPCIEATKPVSIRQPGRSSDIAKDEEEEDPATKAGGDGNGEGNGGTGMGSSDSDGEDDDGTGSSSEQGEPGSVADGSGPRSSPSDVEESSHSDEFDDEELDQSQMAAAASRGVSRHESAEQAPAGPSHPPGEQHEKTEKLGRNRVQEADPVDDEDEFGDDEGGSSGDDGDDSDEEGNEGGGGTDKPLPGGKSQAFAKAFAKILTKKVKSSAPDVILAESKTVQRHKQQEQEDEEVQRAAKRRRYELRKRGHEKVPRRGEDSQHDAAEKQLMRLATRGVVMLFNAVAKAKQSAAEGQLLGKKPVKLNKASLLGDLRAAASLAKEVPSSVGGIGGGAQGAGRSQVLKLGRGRDPGAGPSWKVVQEDLLGVGGGGSLKDWDRQVEEEQPPGDELLRQEYNDDVGGEDDDDAW